MNRREGSDVERLLSSTKLKPARPELREKVLNRALQYRRETAWTTPRLRWSLAGSAALLLVVFVADSLVSGAQRDRLIALAGGPRLAAPQPDGDKDLLVAVVGDRFAAELTARADRPPARRSVIGRARDHNRELERLMEE